MDPFTKFICPIEILSSIVKKIHDICHISKNSVHPEYHAIITKKLGRFQFIRGSGEVDVSVLTSFITILFQNHN